MRKSNMNKLLRPLLIIGCLAFFTAPIEAQKKSKQPNILFVLIDDLGWKDLGVYGGEFIQTPVTDQLAKEGMRFTQAYASPVCSPTRASLVSGQNPIRHGIWEVLGVSDRPYAKLKSPKMATKLAADVDSYAELLNAQGYTCGIVGKWHAGGKPQDVGFAKINKNITDPTLVKYIEENEMHELGEITAEGIQFIRDHKEEPFFLCVSHHAVHAPLYARTELIDKYNARLRKTGISNIHPTYAAMVEMADESTGLLLDELKELGLDKNTVVVYYSDNGGMDGDMYLAEPTPMATTMLPLRDQKGTLYEGGLRVPLIVKWPGEVAENTVSDTPVHSYDLFSTFIDIGKTKTPAQKVDGISLVPLLKQETATLDRDALYWHFPTNMWTRNPKGAIRKGDYKLIENYLTGEIELYDLADDIGETVNLVKQRPEKAKELYNDLKNWRDSFGGLMPTENPNYDRFREHEFDYYRWLDPAVFRKKKS
ncbi:DUF4976 domain-containing protein [Flammeovirga pectinis]|uniref:DUF4976 domain-containing protein n=2 Tax=Flammeovirga pectinis TaxID=2494373 RepID=A0A3S9P6F3_9BACT|nr:DUF4976 domain-containing protein [Flammeovirga pectinis]